MSIGCNASTSCTAERGGIFTTSASTTWSQLGIYQYTTDYDIAGRLGNSANASYGVDTIHLAWPGSGAPTIENQLVGGLVTDTSGWFRVGQFGLSPRAFNISTLLNSHLTPLAALRQNGTIPSTSWGYTAGLHNQQTPAYGSLTLGGYDASRFRANNVTFPFGTDISVDLVVGIQAISSDKSGDAALMPTPAYAAIDSELPTMILPDDACSAFERAFNLTYYTQNGKSFYLLTDAQHQNLLSLDPTFTFTLGPSLAGGSTVSIAIPYAAFDLQLSPPLGVAGTRYFPLQRGGNSSLYVLGRSFMQLAYVIADYDRSNFSVSQALFPQNTPAQIKAIYPPGQDTASSSSSSSTGLGGGAIAGIVVGAVVGVALIAAAVFFLVRRRRVQKRAAAKSAELDGASADDYSNGMRKVGGGDAMPDMGEQSPQSPGTASYYAMDAKTELSAESAGRAEMGASRRDSRPELDASAEAAVASGPREMDAQGQEISEMEGSWTGRGDRKGEGGEKDPARIYELA